jgi:hypothetical protein
MLRSVIVVYRTFRLCVALDVIVARSSRLTFRKNIVSMRAPRTKTHIVWTAEHPFQRRSFVFLVIGQAKTFRQKVTSTFHG